MLQDSGVAKRLGKPLLQDSGVAKRLGKPENCKGKPLLQDSGAAKRLGSGVRFLGRVGLPMRLAAPATFAAFMAMTTCAGRRCS